MAKRKIEYHPSVKTLAEFHKKNPKTCDAKTLGTNQPDYYLKNRIEAAYHAGWADAEAYYRWRVPRRTTKTGATS